MQVKDLALNAKYLEPASLRIAYTIPLWKVSAIAMTLD